MAREPFGEGLPLRRGVGVEGRQLHPGGAHDGPSVGLGGPRRERGEPAAPRVVGGELSAPQGREGLCGVDEGASYGAQGFDQALAPREAVKRGVGRDAGCFQGRPQGVRRGVDLPVGEGPPFEEGSQFQGRGPLPVALRNHQHAPSQRVGVVERNPRVHVVRRAERDGLWGVRTKLLVPRARFLGRAQGRVGVAGLERVEQGQQRSAAALRPEHLLHPGGEVGGDGVAPAPEEVRLGAAGDRAGRVPGARGRGHEGHVEQALPDGRGGLPELHLGGRSGLRGDVLGPRGVAREQPREEGVVQGAARVGGVRPGGVGLALHEGLVEEGGERLVPGAGEGEAERARGVDLRARHVGRQRAGLHGHVQGQRDFRGAHGEGPRLQQHAELVEIERVGRGRLWRHERDFALQIGRTEGHPHEGRGRAVGHEVGLVAPQGHGQSPNVPTQQGRLPGVAAKPLAHHLDAEGLAHMEAKALGGHSHRALHKRLGGVGDAAVVVGRGARGLWRPANAVGLGLRGAVRGVQVEKAHPQPEGGVDGHGQQAQPPVVDAEEVLQNAREVVGVRGRAVVPHDEVVAVVFEVNLLRARPHRGPHHLQHVGHGVGELVRAHLRQRGLGVDPDGAPREHLLPPVVSVAPHRAASAPSTACRCSVASRASLRAPHWSSTKRASTRAARSGSWAAALTAAITLG